MLIPPPPNWKTCNYESAEPLDGHGCAPSRYVPARPLCSAGYKQTLSRTVLRIQAKRPEAEDHHETEQDRQEEPRHLLPDRMMLIQHYSEKGHLLADERFENIFAADDKEDEYADSVL